ncbi:unnamed protein product [Rotaria sp. Silwood1]|nr:unnamed protein product [Rotaria sp. Silwood1]
MATASENDATNALEEAQRALQQIDKQSLTEIARYSNPPNTIATLMQAVGIFLQPEISSDKYTWNDGRKLLRKNNFIDILLTFDKEGMTTDQVTRAASYMAREEMQPTVMKNIPRAGTNLPAWVRAMYLYGQMRQQTTSH